VSTNVGGIPEIIQDGVTGLLVAPKDTDALVTASLSLFERPHLRKELGEKAHSHVAEYYSWDWHLTEVLSVYKALIR
jgi:glycosyltransferase involved in cell wall biosynthesis